eukprot:GILJ01005081.1.p1 GENE.GILJ01005081.1~~GILJ01005081.1.p1  ORF type:complete len:373 (+),score=25.00 GILJ01005081.1:113-1120(+)
MPAIPTQFHVRGSKWSFSEVYTFEMVYDLPTHRVAYSESNGKWFHTTTMFTGRTKYEYYGGKCAVNRETNPMSDFAELGRLLPFVGLEQIDGVVCKVFRGQLGGQPELTSLYFRDDSNVLLRLRIQQLDWQKTLLREWNIVTMETGPAAVARAEHLFHVKSEWGCVIPPWLTSPYQVQYKDAIFDDAVSIYDEDKHRFLTYQRFADSGIIHRAITIGAYYYGVEEKSPSEVICKRSIVLPVPVEVYDQWSPRGATLTFSGYQIEDGKNCSVWTDSSRGEHTSTWYYTADDYHPVKKVESYQSPKTVLKVTVGSVDESAFAIDPAWNCPMDVLVHL